jgi:hypothetical protein
MTTPFRYGHTQRPDGADKKCPIIPITIGGKESIDTFGLIDSGADVSAIHVEMAKAIGLDLSAKETESFGLGGGVKTILSKMHVIVELLHHQMVGIDIPVMVVLGDYQLPLLLGRAGFFSKFIITFDEDHEKVFLKLKDVRRH